MFNCLNRDCKASLEQPDGENRYCPKCGAVRVVTDPPDRPSSSKFIRVGYDVFGESTGNFYAYTSLTEAPRRVRSFEPMPSGTQPLFPSCHTTSALTSVESAPVYPPLEKEFKAEIADAVAYNGRIWVLFKNGNLMAYDSQTLTASRVFEPSEWGGVSDQRLYVNDRFIYSLGRRETDWMLCATDIAYGDPEPEPLILDLEFPEVFFDGLEGVALGRNSSGRFEIQPLVVTEDEIIKGKETSMKCSSAEPQSRPWWGRLGESTFLLRPDGVLRMWDDDSQRYLNLWQNEAGAVVGHPHRWGDELIFPVSSAQALGILRIDSTGALKEEELSSKEEADRSPSVCIVDNALYYLHRDRGSAWRLKTYSLTERQSVDRVTIAGTADLLEIYLQQAAVNAEPYVFVVGRSSTKWSLWARNLKQSSFSHQLMGHPSVNEGILFLWEGANTWLVRKSVQGKDGLIQCLPVQL